MGKSVLIFLPDSLQLIKDGYLEGVYKEYEGCEAFYVTNNSVVRDSSRIIGYVGDGLGKFKIKDLKAVHFDSLSLRISLINCGQCGGANIVKIVYDFEAFQNCNVLNSEDEYGVHFTFLGNYLRTERERNVENGHKNFLKRILTLIVAILDLILSGFEYVKVVWSFSATITHFCDNLASYRWFLTEVINEKQLSPKIGNFILSKILDLVLGIALLQLFIENEASIIEFIEYSRETIIHNFRDLLVYLMGSPIGLKLNHAFNNSLGTFFFYHISLWRIFLRAMQPTIEKYFQLLVLPGTFGFSYQIAMLSDLISLATFHVYCIYVYAARLIYLQLRGLLSLWRLFIGRKYNPLREKVDSYEYSQHQLFIGTLGFTVLLFLLPTTTMYYTVFVIFRLVIMIVEDILIRIRHLLHSLPIYTLILWAIRSPNMAGPVRLSYQKTQNGVVTFEARLQTLPLSTSIVKYAPYTIKSSSSLSWGKIFTGVVL